MTKNKRVRVAFDINDTLRNNLGQFQKIYTERLDSSYEFDVDKVTTTDYMDYFPFSTREEYHSFKYETYHYELFAMAEVIGGKLMQSKFLTWLKCEMNDFDEGEEPEVLLVSPFEFGLSIPSTLVFISKMASQVREIYFPINSSTIWDRCDVLITANPKLIKECPEGKHVICITAPYNKDLDVDVRVDTVYELLNNHYTFIEPLIRQ